MDQVTLQILTSPSTILKALLESKLSKSVIGIRSKSLGHGTSMTTVEELIINDNETTIVLKGYDMSGYFLDRHSLRLDEIESVIPFDALFENPFLRVVQKDIDNGKSSSLKVS
jgi:hypothetical protein